MSLTNFSYGVSSFGVPQVGSGIPVTSGKYFWVDGTYGTNATTKGSGPKRDAFKTLSYAVTQCVANRGDVILVAPGYTEAVSSATAFAIANAGISIIGLGNSSNRPLITFTATTATIAISAANILIRNIRFDMAAGGVNSVAAALTVTGANFTLEDCRVIMSDATNKGTSFISLGAGATDCAIRRCRIESYTAGSAQVVLSAAAVSGLIVENNDIRGNFSAALFVSGTTNHLTNIRIANNILHQTNGTAKAVFSLTTSSTGFIAWNMIQGTTWTTAADVVAATTSTGVKFHENYGFDDAAGAVSAVLVPAAGTIA